MGREVGNGVRKSGSEAGRTGSGGLSGVKNEGWGRKWGWENRKWGLKNWRWGDGAGNGGGKGRK